MGAAASESKASSESKERRWPLEAIDWRRWYRLRIAWSVRPGSRCAIRYHLWPSSSTDCTIVASSNFDHCTRSARGVGPSSSDVESFFDFRRTAGEELFARIRPKVAEATQQVGVTQQYKALNDKAKPFMALTGGELPSDLDSYVTDKALDALFVQIAEQEQLIRNNPAERTSEILRDVFGQ